MEASRGDEGHSSGIGVAIDSIFLLEEIGRWVRRIQTCSAAHLAMGRCSLFSSEAQPASMRGSCGGPDLIFDLAHETTSQHSFFWEVLEDLHFKIISSVEL